MLTTTKPTTPAIEQRTRNGVLVRRSSMPIRSPLHPSRIRLLPTARLGREEWARITTTKLATSIRQTWGLIWAHLSACRTPTTVMTPQRHSACNISSQTSWNLLDFKLQPISIHSRLSLPVRSCIRTRPSGPCVAPTTTLPASKISWDTLCASKRLKRPYHRRPMIHQRRTQSSLEATSRSFPLPSPVIAS